MESLRRSHSIQDEIVKKCILNTSTLIKLEIVGGHNLYVKQNGFI